MVVIYGSGAIRLGLRVARACVRLSVERGTRPIAQTGAHRGIESCLNEGRLSLVLSRRGTDVLVNNMLNYAWPYL